MCTQTYTHSTYILKIQGIAYLCYGQFLLGHISRYIDHLHTISQRLWNSICNIGCADEKDLGNVYKTHYYENTTYCFQFK